MSNASNNRPIPLWIGLLSNATNEGQTDRQTVPLTPADNIVCGVVEIEREDGDDDDVM